MKVFSLKDVVINNIFDKVGRKFYKVDFGGLGEGNLNFCNTGPTDPNFRKIEIKYIFSTIVFFLTSFFYITIKYIKNKS